MNLEAVAAWRAIVTPDRARSIERDFNLEALAFPNRRQRSAQQAHRVIDGYRRWNETPHDERAQVAFMTALQPYIAPPPPKAPKPEPFIDADNWRGTSGSGFSTYTNTTVAPGAGWLYDAWIRNHQSEPDDAKWIAREAARIRKERGR